MPSEAVEQFRAAYEAYSRGELDAVLANLAPEFVVNDHVILESTEGPVGPHALTANLSRFDEAFERFEVEALEFEEFDGGMLVRIRAKGRIEREGGLDVELEAGQLWRTRQDGLAVSLDVYPSWQEARRAAGLES